MRLKWSKHIMQCNPVMIERSSEDVRWRSFLRWGTVKVKLLETNAPQKILRIRFETKTWLMENQVKLSCFSPVRVHLEIWLQLFWRLLDQNQSRFNSRNTLKQQLKLDVCSVTLKEQVLIVSRLLRIKYEGSASHFMLHRGMKVSQVWWQKFIDSWISSDLWPLRFPSHVPLRLDCSLCSEPSISRAFSLWCVWL